MASSTCSSVTHTSTVNQTLPQIIHILQFFNGRVAVELWPLFSNQLDETMAVRRTQIRPDECMAVGSTQLLHMASLQTLQTKIAMYNTHYTEDWQRPVFLSFDV